MQYRRISFTAAFVGVVITAGAAVADPQDQDVFTDFEGISSTNFSIGSSPNTATFSGNAFSGTVGDFDLYFSGFFAWMVNEGGTGTIDFETNAQSVCFYARTNPFAFNDTIITAFDDDNNVIEEITIETGSGWNLVNISGSIDRIEVFNTDSNQMNAIDDFGFTPVDETQCVGDLDDSGDVGVSDLLAVLAAWGPCEGKCPEDFDGCGSVDVGDLLTLLSNWGPCP